MINRTISLFGLLILLFGCAERTSSSNLDTIRALLLEQLKNTRTDEGWFVPTKRALEGLTAEQASWKDSTENHSITQLVSHLTFWQETNFKAFHGDSTADFNGENEVTFDIYSETEWEATLKKMNSIQIEWEDLVANASEEELLEWNKEIANMSAHTAYHTGQIVYIRKRKGWWK